MDPATLELPEDMADISKEVVLFCVKIDKISSKRLRNKRILLVTEWYLFLLKKRRMKKKLVLSYMFRWVDIIRIVAESSNEFRVEFAPMRGEREMIKKVGLAKRRSQFLFSHPKAGKVISKMYSYLCSYLFPENLPEVVFPVDYEKPEDVKFVLCTRLTDELNLLKRNYNAYRNEKMRAPAPHENLVIDIIQRKIRDVILTAPEPSDYEVLLDKVAREFDEIDGE